MVPFLAMCSLVMNKSTTLKNAAVHESDAKDTYSIDSKKLFIF